MRIPKITFPSFSETLKRITSNFNSCLPPFLRTRQKPSDLPTEIDPLISSDSNNSDSTHSDKFTDSANDSLVKPVSPLNNTKLTLHEALDALVEMQNNNYRPVSGAGVFGNYTTPTIEAEVLSANDPLVYKTPPHFQRTDAIRQRGRTYQRPRPRLRPRRPTEEELTFYRETRTQFIASPQQTLTSQTQIIPTQLRIEDPRNDYIQTINPFKDAVDSGSDSDVEQVDLNSSIAQVLGQFASQAANDFTGGVSAISGALASGFSLFTTQPPIPSTAATTTPNTSTAQTPPQTPPQTQTITEHQRVVAAARALLPTMSFRKPPMTAQVLDKKPENHTATPVATTAKPSVGRLDPELLKKFEEKINATPSRPASPALKPNADIQPAVPPMAQPQQPISPAQLNKMPSTLSKYPDFTNAEKIKIFNYINQVTGLGYTNIPDDEKPLYFDYSIDMIEQKTSKILEASNSSIKSAFVNSQKLLPTSLDLDRAEKIRLFDLINKYLKFDINNDDRKKIDKFTFILKAIYYEKKAIVKGLDGLVKNEKEKNKQSGVAI